MANNRRPVLSTARRLLTLSINKVHCNIAVDWPLIKSTDQRACGDVCPDAILSCFGRAPRLSGGFYDIGVLKYWETIQPEARAESKLSLRGATVKQSVDNLLWDPEHRLAGTLEHLKDTKFKKTYFADTTASVLNLITRQPVMAFLATRKYGAETDRARSRSLVQMRDFDSARIHAPVPTSHSLGLPLHLGPGLATSRHACNQAPRTRRGVAL